MNIKNIKKYITSGHTAMKLHRHWRGNTLEIGPGRKNRTQQPGYVQAPDLARCYDPPGHQNVPHLLL